MPCNWPSVIMTDFSPFTTKYFIAPYNPFPFQFYKLKVLCFSPSFILKTNLHLSMYAPLPLLMNPTCLELGEAESAKLPFVQVMVAIEMMHPPKELHWQHLKTEKQWKESQFVLEIYSTGNLSDSQQPWLSKIQCNSFYPAPMYK